MTIQKPIYCNCCNFVHMKILPVGSNYNMLIYKDKLQRQTGILIDEEGNIIISLTNMIQIGVNENYLYLAEIRDFGISNQSEHTTFVFDFRRNIIHLKKHQIDITDNVAMGFMGKELEPSVTINDKIFRLTGDENGNSSDTVDS